ncbi:hypothetical protein L8C07_06130 [Paenibacillus sp. CMAA1739]|uniref:Acb2/Tad1 domain-containing protein n=1 Tax=Paenibacillus ottowii TaxID=2315729 RepID=UPI002DBFCE34|nr:hypothetical protein [Paenibacillus sp. CMAA1739]MEC4565518.1 hypothetical protein [Paenibacillus sp. CMAA1739]
MLKCVDYQTGRHIGEVEDWVAEGNENEYELTYNDYTYNLKYVVNDVAFFVKQQFNSTIENNFSYHSPKDDQRKKYELIRSKAKEAAYLFDELVPNGREKSLALTNLEQAVFWANAGIARN